MLSALQGPPQQHRVETFWISVLFGNPCPETLWASNRMLFHPVSWGESPEVINSSRTKLPAATEGHGLWLIHFIVFTTQLLVLYNFHHKQCIYKVFGLIFSKNTSCTIQQPLLELITITTELVSCDVTSV
jgi:hypothetical protein